MDILHLLSIIGSLFGAMGTTIMVLGSIEMKPKALIIWTIGNGSLLIFTFVSGYYEQTMMWIFYEVVNILGLLECWGYIDIKKLCRGGE